MRNVAEAESSDWDEARAQRRGGEWRGRTWAKVLFVAVLVGLGFMQGLNMADAPNTPVAYENGRLVATDALENALHNPGTRAIDGGPVAGRPFANPAGERCRRFIDGPVRGVACQVDGDWRIEEMRQAAADPDAGAAVPAAGNEGASAPGAAVDRPSAQPAAGENQQTQ